MVPGIYWLFVLLDKTLLSIFIFLILFVIFDIFRGDGKFFISLSRAWLVAIPALLLTFPMTFAQNTIHLKSLRAEGKVFHLSAAPMFDINYNLSKCDTLGIVCVTIFHSGDVTSPDWATLHYNKQTQTLKVVDPEEGELFSYKVSKFLSLGFDD